VKGRVALIAGDGTLPLEAARSLEAQGRPPLVVALEGITSDEIRLPGREVLTLPFGRLQGILDLLKRERITECVLAGGVRHTRIFDPVSFDKRLADLLLSLPDRRGNAILKALAGEIEREGVAVLSHLDVLPGLLAPRGVMAGPEPSAAQWADIAFGLSLAKEVARLDIGQAVAVKGRAVVAVEGMEGTDRCIRRAGELAGGGVTVVKVSAPDHDFRVDVPVAGPDTVLALAEAGGGVLAVEAGRSFLLEREEMFELCRERGVTLVGVD
jgi:UDP-2,3-diacylglucosamine hydrolase